MEFETINHLLSDPEIDQDHWITKEVLRFARKDAVDRQKSTILHVPGFVKGVLAKCKNNHEFTPDWLMKWPPYSPLKLKNGGMLIPTTINIPCNECDENAVIDINVKDTKAYKNVAGDEAFRTVDKKKIFVYTFVSFLGKTVEKEEFEKRLEELKKAFSGKNPSGFVVHLKELLSSEKRTKLGLGHRSYTDTIAFIKEYLSILREYSGKGKLAMWISNSASSKEKLTKAEEEDFTVNTYGVNLMRMVYEMTMGGTSPSIYFERTGKDGKAKEYFDGARVSVLWSYITSGVPVKTPEFVEPDFDILLEVADVAAYIVARYLFCVGKMASGRNVKIDFDPYELGNVSYSGANSKGGFLLLHQKGFPGKEFFKGTEWEGVFAKLS